MLLSIPFLFTNQVGVAIFSNNQIVIGNKTFDLKSVRLKLNIDSHDWNDTRTNLNEKVKTLPKWGNYLILGTDKIEFEPNNNLEKQLANFNITTCKNRPVLMLKNKLQKKKNRKNDYKV